MSAFLRSLILPAVMLGVAYGGVKLYIHYSIKTALSELKSKVAPFVTLNWDGVASTWDGRLQIQGVRLQPVGFIDTFRAREVELQTPGLWYLLVDGKKSLRENRPPEMAGLAVRGLAVDLSWQLIEILEKAAAMTTTGQTMAHCGGIERIGARQLRTMGYDSLLMDVGFSYRYRPDDNRLLMQMYADVDSMFSTRADMTLAGNPKDLKPGSPDAPRLIEATIVHQDKSYVSRLEKYCANASNIGVEEYIEAEVNQRDSAYLHSWGIIPGPGLRAAYRQFLQSPGEVRVIVRPPDPVDLYTVHLYKPADALAMLNPAVTVNGAPVSEVSVRNEPTDSVAEVSTGMDAARALPPPSATRAQTTHTEKVDVPAAMFRPVAKTDLHTHVGRPVRLYLSARDVREGIITGVDGGTVHIERRMGVGAMTASFALREVERVEVQF